VEIASPTHGYETTLDCDGSVRQGADEGGRLPDAKILHM
jgi:hypothetical protein